MIELRKIGKKARGAWLFYRSLAVVSLATMACCSCKDSSTSGTSARPPEEQTSKTSSNTQRYNHGDRKEFEAILAEYRRFCEQPHIMISSDSSTSTESPPARQMVKGGWRYVPFIIEAIKSDEIFLCRLLEEITGIDITKRHPKKVRGLRGKCGLWIEWWVTEGEKEYQQKMLGRIDEKS